MFACIHPIAPTTDGSAVFLAEADVAAARPVQSSTLFSLTAVGVQPGNG